MNSTPNEIAVSLGVTSLTVTPRVFGFRNGETVRWVPEDPATPVQSIAVQLAGDANLPRFRRLSADPTTGVFEARVVAAPKGKSWRYLLLVDGTWYDMALDGSARPEDLEDPEDPPELVNETPDPDDK